MIGGDISRVMEPLPGIAIGSSATRMSTGSVREVALLLSQIPNLTQVPIGNRTYIVPPEHQQALFGLVPAGSWLSYDWPTYWRASLLGCAGVAAASGAHWDVEIIDNKVLTWHSSAVDCSEEESVAEAIVRSFSTIEDVAAVYVDTGTGETTVWVFVDGGEYSDVLMDRLLEEEVRVISRFPDQVLAFRYVPTARGSPHREVVGRDATLVFRRPAHG